MKKWTTLLFLVIKNDIMQLVLQWHTDQLFLTDIVEGIIGTSKEGTTGTIKATQKEKKMVTIDLEKDTVKEPKCE